MRKSIWLADSNEAEARKFWGLEEAVKDLPVGARGGIQRGNPSLPNLVWLRVFLDSGLIIPVSKLGAALAYEMDLQKKQRKKLVFYGQAPGSGEPEPFSLSEILTVAGDELMPSRRTWTSELVKGRAAPEKQIAKKNQISDEQVDLVRITLYGLAKVGGNLRLWECGPLQGAKSNYRGSFFCTTLSHDDLADKVCEVIHPPKGSSKATFKLDRTPNFPKCKQPTKSMIKKALTLLVWFRSLQKPPRVKVSLHLSYGCSCRTS